MIYAYSPDTGELINTITPAPWMSTTTVVPPSFNPATAGCFWRNGAWVLVPAAPTPLSPPLPQQAQSALDAITGPRGQVIRCAAAGVAVNAAWVSYIQALRAIANGADKTSTALPAQPPFIAGT